MLARVTSMRKLTLHAVGVCSGVGRDAAATMGVLFSRLSCRIEIPFGNGTASVAAVAYEPGLSGTRRLIATAQNALGEIANADVPWPLPLVFCCPGPAEISRPPANLLARVCAAEPALIGPQSQVVQGGRRALPTAFAAVEKVLASTGAPACVLLGVDSFLDPSRLAIAERRWGLRSMESPGGILPGEAGVALLLGVDDRARDRSQVVALAVGQVDPRTLPGGTLTATVEWALSGAGIRADQIKALAHDMTGAEAVEELYTMMNRIPLRSIGADAVYAPREIIGETGAASGLLGIATMAFFREKQVYDGLGISIASDASGFRSVVVVK